jgi:hypothetical protein
MSSLVTKAHWLMPMVTMRPLNLRDRDPKPLRDRHASTASLRNFLGCVHEGALLLN